MAGPEGKRNPARSENTGPGERKADVAREFGYRDGSAVLQIIKCLQTRAQKDEA